MSHNEHSQKWIKNIISKTIENLGLDVDKTRYTLSEPKNRFMSTIYYVLLQFENKTTGENEEFPIVVKRALQDMIEILHAASQFHNEILFYQMYSSPDDNYAKCFYADERSSTDLVIALENVNKRGYYPCPYSCNSPLEYVLAAMRELGRFHGKGYAMKKLQPEKFFDIVTRLQTRFFKKNNTDNENQSDYVILCNNNPPKLMKYLRNCGHDPIFCDKIEAVFSNAFDRVMMKTLKPLEPLATLCHGDFTLDNILFNTEDDGKYRAMPIDFAYLTYSTPVVDLSTFLCLCCTNEMRRDKFSDIMRAYHDSLKEYLLEAGVWDMEVYSYEVLLEDFKRGGLFGFIIATFHLPVLLGYLKMDKIVEELSRIGMLEHVKRYKYNEELSKILADMLLHLKDLGCLTFFS
ncbi:uncharacterized protein LOC105200817 [Solenopsis invicta]|nr:uncharacterized protein LOC105200817 [Solenopsis invicta]